MHWLNGTSPRQTVVHILMPLLNKYPCSAIVGLRFQTDDGGSAILRLYWKEKMVTGLHLKGTNGIFCFEGCVCTRLKETSVLYPCCGTC